MRSLLFTLVCASLALGSTAAHADPGQYRGWDFSRMENGGAMYCPSKEMEIDWPRSPAESCRPESYVRAHPWAPPGSVATASAGYGQQQYAPPQQQRRICSQIVIAGGTPTSRWIVDDSGCHTY